MTSSKPFSTREVQPTERVSLDSLGLKSAVRHVYRRVIWSGITKDKRRMTKKRLHEIVERAPEGDKVSYVFDIAILTLIFANVVAAIIDTVPSINSSYGQFLYSFEVFSVAIFTLEYIVRAWVCVADEEYAKPFSGRIKYLLTPMALIDMLSILPFYLVTFGVDLRTLRILRLFRLLRIAKASRYFRSMEMLKNVVMSRKEELIMSVAMILVLLVMASSAMYYAEHDTQPEAFSSIPASMWWGVATLTTVGYGDVYPITSLGRLMGAIIAIAGVGMFALPAGLLASGFMEELEANKKGARCSTVCKHCGGELEG